MYYCRFGEDQILDRLTGYLPVGFYIDVGANSPDIDSVTKCFYERGWNGINIEPVLNHHPALLQNRPRDINLAIACGEKSGYVELFVENYLTMGLSTAKKEYAKQEWVSRQVPVDTLANICKSFAQNRVINFLKIDVEGFEANVIKGMDWENIVREYYVLSQLNLIRLLAHTMNGNRY